jgi:NADH-quinone oxidoreductase subunit C
MVHNFNLRLFLRCFVLEFYKVNSMANEFFSVSWLEREMFDMFGIFFLGNMDLRRILTDYGFVGFPLRKDFPLSGFFEVRYDDILKRIVLEPIKLSQEFRLYNFLTP